MNLTPFDSAPVVAIIGRPNVGKSTLFNRIARGRKAVVHDQAGVTRDRNTSRAEWNGREFWVVDTGGITFGKGSELAREIQEQVDAAVEEADVLLLVLDAATGVTVEDEAVIRRLARAGKTVLCAANKADDPSAIAAAYSMTAGAFGGVVPVSARRSNGLDDLFDRLVTLLPPPSPEPRGTDEYVRVAIVGRPNVGKSSLVNAITGARTMIVSDVPGTTRDSVDTPIVVDGVSFLLVDTAGLRRRSRTSAPIEIWSSLRSMRAIERCDVAVLVLDAAAGILDQDVWIASEAANQGKSIVVAANKWDAVEKDPDVARRFEDRFAYHFKFLADSPILYVSAKSGRRVERVLPEAKRLADVRATRIGTARVNEVLREIVDGSPPPANRSARLTRVYYGTQVDVRPPTFAVFTNRPESLEGHYERFLRNQLKERLGLAGTPVRVLVRKREGGRSNPGDGP